MLSQAVKEYNSKGFDHFNSFLTDEIQKLGFVTNAEFERQARSGTQANSGRSTSTSSCFAMPPRPPPST